MQLEGPTAGSIYIAPKAFKDSQIPVRQFCADGEIHNHSSSKSSSHILFSELWASRNLLARQGRVVGSVTLVHWMMEMAEVLEKIWPYSKFLALLWSPVHDEAAQFYLDPSLERLCCCPRPSEPF